MDEFGERVASTLGRRIRRRRQFLDLSQEALAERAGIHRTQISLFEHGERMPLVVTLVKLAAALEVSVAQLLVGVEWEVPGRRRYGGLHGSDPGRPGPRRAGHRW
jgi:transcriptional regulator with XRE-family HTH domain